MAAVVGGEFALDEVGRGRRAGGEGMLRLARPPWIESERGVRGPGFTGLQSGGRRKRTWRVVGRGWCSRAIVFGADQVVRDCGKDKGRGLKTRSMNGQYDAVPRSFVIQSPSSLNIPGLHGGDEDALELSAGANRPGGGAVLFEFAWEVCNQVGGIYQVIRSKAPSMIERWGDRYCLVGPYDAGKAQLEFEPTRPSA